MAVRATLVGLALLPVTSMAACAATGLEASRPAAPAPAATSPPGTAPSIDTTLLPARFVEDRVFVEPVTPDGQKLLFFTDSGGGLYIAQTAVQRLGLPVAKFKTGEGELDVAKLPAFKPDASIPPPVAFDGQLPVKSVDKDEGRDGMLGQAWFRDRTWIFDYPGKQLLLRAPGGVPTRDAAHMVSLGFPKNPAGERAANFPRIQVKIEGVTLDLLLDTGATVSLTDKALAALADGRPAVRATSFIVRSIFDGWHAQHPDWRVIDDADQGVAGSPMIEVPRVSVAGHEVGPVWFTARPDKNFLEFMSQWMDKTIVGALGGSALRFFRMTVDYPNAVAVFERP